MTILLAALLAAGAQAAPAADPALSTPREVVIRPRAGGTVRRYAAYEPSVVFLQDYRGAWYRAALTGDCFTTPYRGPISFRNQGGSEAVDRFTTLVLNEEVNRTCGIASLTLGEPPKGVRSIAGTGEAP